LVHSEVAYCRLNNVSLIIYFVSVLYIVIGITSESLVGRGWTFYPPLSTTGSFVLASGVGTLLGGLIIRGVSSTFSSINFRATTLIRRAGMMQCDTGAYVATIM
jgi:heme/copper-type cytochrome/quinol oxidase subunit 1